MKLINEDCGCDDDYFSVINNSPLLSGNQEMTFDPSSGNQNQMGGQPLTKPIVFERASNNNNNSGYNQIPNIELEVLGKNKINNNNIDMNNHNNNVKLNLTSTNNQMNQNMNQMNQNQMNQQLLNNQMMNPNSLNSMNNINTAQQLNMNNPLVNNVDESNGNYKTMVTNLNYILMVVLALAVNDVAKFYINRAIKFQNGDHKYYIYYVVGLVVIVYFVSRMLNKLN